MCDRRHRVMFSGSRPWRTKRIPAASMSCRNCPPLAGRMNRSASSASSPLGAFSSRGARLPAPNPSAPTTCSSIKPSYPLAVVEAKADYRSPADGMQQAKSYAETLGLLFAYATNGRGIIEFDRATGLERPIDAFPSPRRAVEPLSRRQRTAAKRWRTSCSFPITSRSRSRATTSRSPSTAPSRRSSRASGASC